MPQVVRYLKILARQVQTLMEKVKLQLGSLNMFVVPSIGNTGYSGGLAFLWRSEVNASLLSYSKSHIDMVLNWKECPEKFRITGFYGA